jgi:hypothetical protein
MNDKMKMNKKLVKRLKQQKRDYPEIRWSSYKEFGALILNEYDHDVSEPESDDDITYTIDQMNFDKNGLLIKYYCTGCDHMCYNEKTRIRAM